MGNEIIQTNIMKVQANRIKNHLEEMICFKYKSDNRRKPSRTLKFDKIESGVEFSGRVILCLLIL